MSTATLTRPAASVASSARKKGSAASREQRGPRTLYIDDVSKHFLLKDSLLHVLDHVSFSVEPGEFVSLLGASGCGKSTLLRHIVGLDNDYEGQIRLGSEIVRGTSLDRGVVFQDHRLLPWLSVEDNVSLGLINSKLTRLERQLAVREHLELVGLRGFEKSYPHQLSGGMAQRVAIARGLVNRPEVLLLDEPLGALDAITRLNLQDELLRIWRQEQATMLLITHDVEEALYLSDRIVVLDVRPGRVKGIVPITLAHPRDRVSHAFADLKREVLELLSIEIPGSAEDPSLAGNI
ncbi:ABC-type nitrate/sulfonate/bicarbonate transport system, ATPase component [Opitutaceae bacterium TAV1]|nr:ABC-type nitrate/sulfonate/bicarbonate transport system, ATPase component [Opitutaceae bacterium TAV1]